jgi:transcriptional regulator with XRE-family HTH domain
VPVNADRLISEVGRRLAELREARGLTQQALADDLGKSMRYVQAVEAGSENLTLRTIAAFASCLKVAPLAVLEPPAHKRRAPGRPKKTR